jgi:hypothetical protein
MTADGTSSRQRRHVSLQFVCVVLFRRLSSRVTWTLSAELMAKVLAEKGYHYQFLFARNAKHVDRPTVAQTLPAALEWLWKGYP